MSPSHNPPSRVGRVLVVAGSDSGGGAGVQADVKTITALGGYAATAITAVTVQNTLGVIGMQELSAELVHAQAHAVLEDIGADAVKTGMLANADSVHAAAEELAARAQHIPIVVDPVLVSTSGHVLGDDDVVEAIKSALLHLASLREHEGDGGFLMDEEGDKLVSNIGAVGTAMLELERLTTTAT